LLEAERDILKLSKALVKEDSVIIDVELIEEDIQ